MDWNRAIEWNRNALNAVLVGLVAMAGLAGAGLPFAPCGRRWPAGSDEAPARGDRTTLARALHRAVARLLRPAESAARRLVIVAARGMVVALPRPRAPRPKPRSIYVRDRRSTGVFVPRGVPLPGSRPRVAPAFLTLPLFDPPRALHGRRRWMPKAVPRICVPGVTPRFPVPPRMPPSPRDRLDATRLVLRLDALGRALDDLPGHARRFARWRARQAALRERCRGEGQGDPAPPNGARLPRRAEDPAISAAARPRRVRPLRAGRPPGSHWRSRHEVHALLRETHALAVRAMQTPDTS